MCRLYSDGPTEAYLRLCARTGLRGHRVALIPHDRASRQRIRSHSCHPEHHLEQYAAWTGEALIGRIDLPDRPRTVKGGSG